jgi:hypothetical protein
MKNEPMREFIEQEKGRLQGLLRLFNERGSRMEAYGDDGEHIFGELIDSFAVTRLAPHFDAQGNFTGADFWLLWKYVGYDNGWQYAHTIKVIDAKARDMLEDCWLIVDLADDLDRRYHVELIEPVIEKDYAADWKRWQAYKAQNAEMFARIDAELLAEHVQIAEEWQ